MIKVIIFDFDGVIVDSNRLKYQAYFDIFPKDEETQNIVKKVVNKHREKTRFFIIDQILKKRKGLPGDIDFYAQKYNEIVEIGVIKCPVVKGALAALEKLFQQYPLYLFSGTPLNNLKKILKERSLDLFFRDIYGAPKSKTENLAEIIKREKISGKEVLIIGDGQSDLEEAQKFGCKFIGIRNCFNNFTAQDFNILDDLRNLPDLINTFTN